MRFHVLQMVTDVIENVLSILLELDRDGMQISTSDQVEYYT